MEHRGTSWNIFRNTNGGYFHDWNKVGLLWNVVEHSGTFSKMQREGVKAKLGGSEAGGQSQSRGWLHLAPRGSTHISTKSSFIE